MLKLVERATDVGLLKLVEINSKSQCLWTNAFFKYFSNQPKSYYNPTKFIDFWVVNKLEQHTMP